MRFDCAKERTSIGVCAGFYFGYRGISGTEAACRETLSNPRSCVFTRLVELRAQLEENWAGA